MEIKKGEIVNFTQVGSSIVTPTTRREISPTRANSFSIRTSSASNYGIYTSLAHIYKAIKWPFEHIANAGKQIGDRVEQSEVDASIAEGWQNLEGEVVEYQGKIIAWQNRGETAPITKQLPSSAASKELISIEQDLPIIDSFQNQNIKVIEGIGVTYEPNDQLEDNPYLKPLEYKKAA